MQAVKTISARVSFGLDVQKPWQLQTRPTGDVLCDVLQGRWREPINRLRGLPFDSEEQCQAKKKLPYCTWSGVFHRRCATGLIRHSGQIGVDLDDLSEQQCVAAIQRAVADEYCLAAFRSARGSGVRLLFRVPLCSAEQHSAIFEQVVEHVRRVYGRESDPQCADVCRASFVSFDRGLWANPSAQVLSINGEGRATQRLTHHLAVSTCGLYAGLLAASPWHWFGRFHAGCAVKPDGTARTHWDVLGLGKAIALHADRLGVKLGGVEVDEALGGFASEFRRRGVRLRGRLEEYRAELETSVKGATRKAWFREAADFWLRWTRHPAFPRTGEPKDRLLFAIREHSKRTGKRQFFIGARDAGLVAGVCYQAAARILKRMVADGRLELLTKQRPPRHAFEYRLKEGGEP